MAYGIVKAIAMLAGANLTGQLYFCICNNLHLKQRVIEAVERVVKRKADPSGHTALVEMGPEELAFEVVVLRQPSILSAEAVAQPKERLVELHNATRITPIT